LKQPFLAVENLTLGYDRKPVVHDVSFRVERGESVALLGVNGSGKSTLLMGMSKSLSPMAGDVRVEGVYLSAISYREAARLVSYVPQQEGTPYPFSVREVVLLGRIAHSDGLIETPEDHRAAEAAMAEADCLAYADAPITELSGGERQRVLIARALAQSAPILLMDEPTAHLDLSHQLSASMIARRHAENSGVTIAAIHDLNLAADFAQRAVVMQKGRIVWDGPVEALLESPQLEEIYGVRMRRVRDGSRTRVFAEA